MKNKLFSILTILIFTIILVSCDFSEVDPEPIIPDPSVELVVDGNLFQEYLDENSELTPVTFSIKYNNFEENEIDYREAQISWFVNYTDGGSDSELTIQPIIPSQTTVFAEVLVAGELYETNVLDLNVFTQSVEIDIINNFSTSNTVDLTFGSGDQLVEFSANITGTASLNYLIWVVTMLNDSGVEVSTLEFETEVTNQQTSFSYEFINYGNYRIEARYLGFSSNYNYVNVSYGDFEIVSAGNSLVYVVDENNQDILEPILLEVPELSIDGTYQWFLNDELIEGATSTEYTHNNFALGQYKYQVVFTPFDLEATIQASSPKLVVYGQGVSTEAEFLQALDEEVPAIVLLNDIVYTKLDDKDKTNGTLDINYPVVISGGGFKLSSQGIFKFINVKANNVSFHNIHLSRAGRYMVHVMGVDNAYFEDVIFSYPGAGGLTDPGAGIFVENSLTIINNVEFIEGYNSGVRIEGTTLKPSQLIIHGEFVYNITELAFPIISIRSNTETATIVGTGFDSFVLPLAQNTLIRRWSRDAKPITWNLHAPYIAEYRNDEILDLSGIAISVSMLDSNLVFGISFVRMFLDMFNQHGRVLITDLDDNVLKTYYVVGYDVTAQPENPNIGEANFDNLIYHDSPVDGNQVNLELDGLEPGQYKVKVDIGGELYLGFFVIQIRE